MEIVGYISKMQVEYAQPVHYTLALGEARINLNPLVNQKIRLDFLEIIQCQYCSRTIKKSYGDGFCYVCAQQLARADWCIMQPTRCHYHVNTCREPQWGEANCMIPYVVYLANTSGLKVGITRQSQVFTRWADQGASAAVPLLIVPNRRVSGFAEQVIAGHVSDKTHWQKMLKGPPEAENLLEYRESLLEKVKPELLEINEKFAAEVIQWPHNPQVTQIEYPVARYLSKIASLSFNKQKVIEGTLLGIKGQYLMFEEGVLNLRKHSGYQIALSF